MSIFWLNSTKCFALYRNGIQSITTMWDSSGSLQQGCGAVTQDFPLCNDTAVKTSQL